MNNQSTKVKDARSSNAMAATSHPLATEEALKIPRKIPSNYAKKFRWDNVGKTFLSNLQNTRRSKPGSYVVSDNPVSYTHLRAHET